MSNNEETLFGQHCSLTHTSRTVAATSSGIVCLFYLQ